MDDELLRIFLVLIYVWDTEFQKLWDFDPDLSHFYFLLYNFVYTVKAYIKLSGKLRLEPLIVWYENFLIFSTIFGVLMVFSRPDMS